MITRHDQGIGIKTLSKHLSKQLWCLSTVHWKINVNAMIEELEDVDLNARRVDSSIDPFGCFSLK